MLHALARRARATGIRLIAGLACFALAGCFDLEQDLTVKGSGAGDFQVTLRIDPAFKDALQNETILGAQKAPVEVTRTVKEGQFVQKERVTFNSLSELRLPNETLSIVSNGAEFFGVGPKDLTLTRKVENAGADASSAGIMRTVFADRTYTFKVSLPGWIGKAYPLQIGDEQVSPQVNGSTVSWQIPMSKAITANELIYKVDFYAFMNIRGNVTAERVNNPVSNIIPGAGTP
ncbi:MAG TPA: hypothetical protein VEH07_02860 [Alphaproteobacteria bacterium]|nr:hypothetical protein [Alphaproteobacteria bacterium]